MVFVYWMLFLGTLLVAIGIVFIRVEEKPDKELKLRIDKLLEENKRLKDDIASLIDQQR